MWPTALKLLGGSLLTLALVWALVLGWWQSNDHEPSKLDLGLYLVALPLALVGGYLLLRGFIDHLKSPSAPAQPAAPTARDDDPLALTAAKSEAAERGFTIAMIDGYIVTSAGASADETLAAVEEGKRPEPSSRLTDDSGFPVFLAEVPDLDVDAMRERSLRRAVQLGELSEREQIVRSLSLLERLLDMVNDRLPEVLGREGVSPTLRVVWVVPAAWKGIDLTVMKAWLQAGLSALPGENPPDISMVPASGELEAMQVLDDINLRVNRDPSSGELILLLGVVSGVDEQGVAQGLGGGRLFTAEHQQRQIPGEGGVALLLAGKPLIDRCRLEACAMISRVGMGFRDKAVDAGGRVTGKLIAQLTAGLLDVTGVEHSAIKTAVLDTDHRANNLTEALEGLGSDFDHLDPVRDCLAVGASTGDLAPIGGLVALACARARVIATEAPALCISNQHHLGRAVLVALPVPAEADINPGSI